MELRNKKVIVPAGRENISLGDLVYWDCTDLTGLEYEPDVLIHDSDGCEYTHEKINVATGVVIKKINVNTGSHMWSYDVLCSDNVVRTITEYSVWVVRK